MVPFLRAKGQKRKNKSMRLFYRLLEVPVRDPSPDVRIRLGVLVGSSGARWELDT